MLCFFCNLIYTNFVIGPNFFPFAGLSGVLFICLSSFALPPNGLVIQEFFQPEIPRIQFNRKREVFPSLTTIFLSLFLIADTVLVFVFVILDCKKFHILLTRLVHVYEEPYTRSFALNTQETVVFNSLWNCIGLSEKDIIIKGAPNGTTWGV